MLAGKPGAGGVYSAGSGIASRPLGFTFRMGWVLGLPVGLLLGVVVHRGDFCMHSAIREVLAGRPGSQVRAYLTALALQLAAVILLAVAPLWALGGL